MNDLFIPLISLLVGVIATVLASQYYFRKSIKKSLTLYLQFKTELFTDLEFDLKKHLHIRYKKSRVENLTQIQYIVKNTGCNIINNITNPLVISMTGENIFLNQSILDINPKGKEIKLLVSEDKKKIQLFFPFLNDRDFFTVKLLVNGIVEDNDIKASISADGLPPIVKIKDINKDKKIRSYKNLLINSSILTIAFFILFYSTYTPTEMNVNWPIISNDNTPLYKYEVYVKFIKSLTIEELKDISIYLLNGLMFLFLMFLGMILTIIGLSYDPKKLFFK